MQYEEEVDECYWNVTDTLIQAAYTFTLVWFNALHFYYYWVIYAVCIEIIIIIIIIINPDL